MARKTASTTAVLGRTLVREPGHTRRSARTSRLRQTTRTARRHCDHSRDRGQSAGHVGPRTPNITGPEVSDDFPDFAAVAEHELDAIEAYLGASLEEVLGGLD